MMMAHTHGDVRMLIHGTRCACHQTQNVDTLPIQLSLPPRHSSQIVIALTYLGSTPPHPPIGSLAAFSYFHLSLHVTLTSPRGLPLYLEVGGSTLLLEVMSTRLYG
jgi:hypothetical protein